MSLCLTHFEIADLCAPLTQPAAQCVRLRAMGLTVISRPNGTPIVSRANFERVMGGAEASNDDDEAAARGLRLGSRQNIILMGRR